MTNVPNLFPSNTNHVVLANHKWVDQGGALSSTFEVAVTGDELSAIFNAQNNINSGGDCNTGLDSFNPVKIEAGKVRASLNEHKKPLFNKKAKLNKDFRRKMFKFVRNLY